MNQHASRQYDSDEVTRIIRRALKLKNEDTIRHQDLIDTAAEIGIDPQLLETAIKQERREYKKESIRKARFKRRKAGFYSHLGSYLTSISALLAINIFTPGPWWFQWPVLGWGIGLAFHFKAVFFPVSQRRGARGKMRRRHSGLIMCE